MTPFDTDLVRLALEIEKHMDGYIDAYLGPAELKTAVSATPARHPQELLADAAHLQATIPTDSPTRQAYLQALLRAMTCSIHLINGKSIPYLEEVAQIFDIHPQPVPETLFESAHRELDTLLPGSGPVALRLEAQRQQFHLPNDKVLPLLELARDEARRRTLALFDIPGDNGVEITLTHNQPWGAYNWYKGNGRSHIEFNTDIPISALGLISTFAHEGYPGHHTEGVLKERLFAREKQYGEAMFALLHSPAAVIAEAIATTAVEIIFDNHSHHAWTLEVLLPKAGIETTETAESLHRQAAASNTLRYVTGNAAIAYHTGKLTREETIDYIQTYALSTPERAAKSFAFISHPLFRAYIFTYTHGYDLITAAAGESAKTPIFHQLLTAQVLPSELAKTAVTHTTAP